jgi:hypothetical protein
VDSLGGVIVAEPSVETWSVDNNRLIQQNKWNGSAWTGWNSLELQTYSTVEACSASANTLDIFAIGNKVLAQKLEWCRMGRVGILWRDF